MSQFISDRNQKVAFTIEADLSFTVIGPHSFTDEEWREYLDRVAAFVQARGSSSKAGFSYVGTLSLTAAQRHMVAEKLGPLMNPRTAVLTPSALARVTTNTVSVLVRAKNGRTQLKAFRPEQFGDACAWIGPDAQQNEARLRELLLEGMRMVRVPPEQVALVLDKQTARLG